MGKRIGIKFVAVLLVCTIVVGLLPLGLLTTALANNSVSSYTVYLKNEGNVLDEIEGVTVTMTKQGAPETQKTIEAERGVAIFENFVEVGTTYTVTVEGAVGYELETPVTITVEDELTRDVELEQIQKVRVSGQVTDDKGNPYAGATIAISGYFTLTTTSGSDGTYEFESYQGKEITIEVKAEEEKYASITSTAIYNSDQTVNHQFQVKSFQILTTCGEHGSLQADGVLTDIAYGESRNISIQSNNGYCIDTLRVDGTTVAQAEGQKSFTQEFTNITDHHKVDVTFKRMTYTITFTVGEHGDVTYGGDSGATVTGGSVDIETVFEESTDPDLPTSVEVVATPAENYRVSQVVVDGSQQTFSENNYIHTEELKMTKNHTFSVVFAPNEYRVTVECQDNGSATWENGESTAMVKHGESATLSIHPYAGYAVSAATVEGTPIQVEENEDGVFLRLENVQQSKTVVVAFEQPEPVQPQEQISNDYYTMSFTKEPVKEPYLDGDTYVVAIPKDAQAILTPQSPYMGIKIHASEANGGFQDSITLSDTTQITNLYVKEGPLAGNKKQVTVNIKVIIDQTVPELKPIQQPEWTNQAVTVQGTAVDRAESSGLDRVVWSEGAPLTEEQVLQEQQNKAPITADGGYSFVVEGAQDTTYYVYAVDLAGNVSQAQTVDIHIDTTVPTITHFTFSTEENSVVEELINFATFGTFCKENIYVTVQAKDEEVSSGLKEITLYHDEEVLATKTVQGNSATFELTQEEFHEKTAIDAVVTDTAQNESQHTKPTDEGVTTQAKSDQVQIVQDETAITIEAEEPKAQDNWYDGNVVFQVQVENKETGIRTVEILMNGKLLTEDQNGVDLTQDFSETGEVTNQKTFVVSTEQNPLDGENTIDVVVKSNTGTTSMESYTVNIDTTRPDITDFQITDLNDTPLDKILNYLTFGIFFNEQVKITVTAEDRQASSGVESITLYLGDEEETKEVDENDQATFVVTKEELEENTVYATEISAIATDYVQNSTQEKIYPDTVNSNIEDSSLMLENVKPTIEVMCDDPASDKNPNTADEKDWYAQDVTFEVVAQDENSGLRHAVVTINGETVAEKDFVGEQQVCTPYTFTVSTADEGVKREEDGSYILEVMVTDNAGNVETYAKTIYKDDEAAYITGFDFQAVDYVEGAEDQVHVEVTDYGFYFREDTLVTISAKDDAPTAGVKTIRYYTVDYTQDPNGIQSQVDTLKVDENGQCTLRIPANFKGQIYAKATDNVDNVQEAFVTPDSVIVEDGDKHETEEHIFFEKADTPFTANDGTELYGDDVDVTITVADTYSGIRAIQWSVEAPYDTESNQGGQVILNNDMSVEEGTETDWKQTKTEGNLVTEMQKTITVNHNSNNVVVRVTMMDRAGNTTEKEIEFSIDKTDPYITVDYADGEVSDPQNPDFFSTPRTAIITILERNFRASDVAFATANTDQIIPDVDLTDERVWKRTENQENPDATMYVATVVFAKDGDYTFDFAYRDRVQRPGNTVPQQQFTIDMTKPVVSVSYDNHSARNGNYYKNARTATITIHEHNFDPSRVSILGTATDNQQQATFPALSGWSNQGNDIHTATISYSADAKYTFDMEFRDMANNSMDEYTPEEFYVDQTAPNLEISGVADQSANNGDVIPVITYQDTNFDEDAVSIILTGANCGQVDYAGSYTGMENGQTYTYANFERTQDVDDIYVLTAKLTDLAGNETEKQITFSVNRFGSVYDLSNVKSILNKYLPEEQDIIFTETNVNTLDRESILLKMVKNGTPVDLVEGRDYTVNATGGSGQWSVYTYTVHKALFKDDGRYSITVYSVDAAGNVNENIDESKTAELSFGIDKTIPVIVPVDLESGKQYPVEGKTVDLEIKDNLVLESVYIYLNDQEVEYTSNGESYQFLIPESNSLQKVRIVAEDAAGNTQELNFDDILVSTNLFVRWYNNTPLFIGSILGVSVAVIGIAALAIFGKKKKVGSQATK